MFQGKKINTDHIFYYAIKLEVNNKEIKLNISGSS